MSNINVGLDLVWGAAAIGRELNLSERQTYYVLEKGLLPGKKVGAQWVTSRHAIRTYFADLVPVEAA
ncbi:DNA-binding protein [Mesorhizobium jarvisii]|uniref:DNA-binding protein n=1 Tax=Mesorhizobium jarvisii TaxID=1777867 RepID=UPI001F0A1D2A|nr:DNA-binding protein [Mesorhizobium jarvisii]MCH4560312.1 DNA-binding protein [Mesorhizobium jarvisii]